MEKTPTLVPAEDLIRSINVGDRVTILVPNGQKINRETGKIEQEWKESTGKAVICNHKRDPNNLTVALNMGGKFGTPGVATVQNIVAVGKRKAYRE